MNPTWDDHTLSLETADAISSRMAELKSKKYDPVYATIADVINFDGDKDFWAKAFSLTRSPEGIETLKRDLMRNKIRDVYVFFKLNAKTYPAEYETMKPIAKAFQEIQALKQEDFEPYFMTLIGETHIGIICVLYDCWGRKLYADEEEYDQIMARVYKHHGR